MQPYPLLGLFGGTFNPIHRGHIALAHSVLETLSCAQIRFIPAAMPPHKAQPIIAATDRAAMVQLAIQHHPHFVLDTLELERSGPSYTVDTLQLMRQQFPHASLCLILGQDSYANLMHWHAWQALLDHAHLLVVHRAHAEPSLTLHAAHIGKQVPITVAASVFSQHQHGYISYLTVTPPDISSTLLRQQLSQANPAADAFIPEAVLRYIHTHHLYLPPREEA